METGKQPGKVLSLGFQHVLAMYAGAVIVPLIIGGAMGLSAQELAYLVSIDLAASGLATLLQVWKNKFFGIGLPVVLGCSFTGVAPMIAIGKEYGLSGIYGAIIASGIIILVLSTFFSKIIKLFPPVVIGTVVTVIGVTLIPVAINNMAGGQGASDFGSPKNLILSFSVLLLIILMNRFFKGFIRAISILIGLIAGTVAAYFMGMIDLGSVQDSAWYRIIEPLHFSTPSFHISAIITMTIVAIVSLIESTGVFFALSEICDQPLDEKSLERGYRSEGLAVIIGGLFNAFPYTTFSQNVGLIQLTKVKSRTVIAVCGIFLIVLGFIPKISTLTTLIPNAVLGGAMIAMFGMVVASGVRMLSKVDFNRQDNLLIIACSIGLGLGVTVQPDLFAKLPIGVQIITNNGIVAGSMTAIILNLIFNTGRKVKTSKAKSKVQSQVHIEKQVQIR
ncbi:xanthine permease [Scopulibacillus darangshiensis]|uniref:Xanthine permease n=1 Tax=Scopulibacillus darangshiensis TaxID=442528 RepID=A0A4R2NQ43_9BACL|nr:nucleobase:cation symporter-2 family protein [Scopulibacillus darangshiensis]TCP23484.1 xanthine permease [Scopulibacillus darangshiensis]